MAADPCSDSVPPTRGRGRKGRLSPAAIDRAELDLEVVRLRVAGESFAAIGAQLGRTGGWAHKATDRAFRRAGTVAGVEELRTLELERLDAIHVKLWSRMEAADDDAYLAYVESYVELSRRRAAIAGLDAPPARRPVAAPSPSSATIEPTMVENVTEYLALVDQIVEIELAARLADVKGCPCSCHGEGGIRS